MAINEIVMLLFALTQQVVLMPAAAFLFFTLRPVRKLGSFGSTATPRELQRNKLFLALVFGLFGILGNYSADPVFHSYANLRAMSVITGGLLGGPVVGLGAGLIAGGYRYLIDIGGFSSAPCALATIMEGVAAGWLHMRLGARNVDWRTGSMLAFVGESLHMLLVLTMARPFAEAWALIQVISVPMVSLNALGAGVFIHIIKLHGQFHEVRDSNSAQKILSIANKTVAHLRFGLNLETARETAQIILDEVDAAAVALTDRNTVLAHMGVGSDHHFAGQLLITKATRNAVNSGKAAFIHTQNEIGCSNPQCPFRQAIIIPLHKQEKVVGILKLYGTESHPLSRITYELTKGLGELFSTQLELEEIETRDRLLAQAEIGRLQAQINPHFLFNALNAIGSLCRTNPLKARSLILDLAQYMRKNLDNSRELIPLADELEQVEAYLTIEKARFGERIQFETDVSDDAQKHYAPPLMVQPLVENAIRHGLAGKEQGGIVRLSAKVEDDMLLVDVVDNGVGMTPEQIEAALPSPWAGKSSIQTDKIGLKNCHQRLLRLYGPEHGLQIQSKPGAGSRVSLRIPVSKQSKPLLAL